jgi:hypothetical protein
MDDTVSYNYGRLVCIFNMVILENIWMTNKGPLIQTRWSPTVTITGLSLIMFFT